MGSFLIFILQWLWTVSQLYFWGICNTCSTPKFVAQRKFLPEQIWVFAPSPTFQCFVTGVHALLTLLASREHIVLPLVAYLRITLQSYARTCWTWLLPNYESGKGHYAFYPKNCQKYQNFVTNQVNRLPTDKTHQKPDIISEGFGHPHFMNPFEYGKSFYNKSFTKRIGIQIPPNPKIFRGGTICPPGL